MKRTIQLPISIKESSATEITVSVLVDQESLVPWCMELILLEKGVIEFFAVADQSYNFRLKIRLDHEIHRSRRGDFVKSAKGIDLSITPTELELWLDFFLKYYCNKVADVDHLDLEVQSSTPNELFLTLKVDNSLSPVTEAEARHRLNLL